MSVRDTIPTEIMDRPADIKGIAVNEPGKIFASDTYLISQHSTDPALRVFKRIAECWQLTPHEQMTLLGLDSILVLQTERHDGATPIADETMKRISLVLGIFKCLEILLPKTSRDWIRKPNSSTIFAGRSALDRMMSGNVSDLEIVHAYLAAQVASED